MEHPNLLLTIFLTGSENELYSLHQQHNWRKHVIHKINFIQ